MPRYSVLVARTAYGQIFLNAESEEHAAKRVTEGLLCDISGTATETEWEVIDVNEAQDGNHNESSEEENSDA